MSTPYIEYESIDVLLSLQHPRSGVHDEMTFYVSGQVIELLFKLAVNEVRECQTRLDNDDLAGALKLLRRIERIEQLLVKVWDVLDTLTPNDFNGFRDYLGTASGLQSYMYRALEFVLGNKCSDGTTHAQREVVDAFESPSLWDTVTALLSRNGYDIDREHLDRDVTSAYEPSRTVAAAWLSIYKEQNRFHELGEALMAVAAGFTSWRMRHLVTVERLIGFKPGTGGTTGVSWLRTIADHRFFPELWTVRTELD